MEGSKVHEDDGGPFVRAVEMSIIRTELGNCKMNRKVAEEELHRAQSFIDGLDLVREYKDWKETHNHPHLGEQYGADLG